MPDETKSCRLCGLDKPLSEFYRAVGCIDGRRGECRECFQDLRRQREVADPQRVLDNRERVRRWQEANPERDRARRVAYQKTDAYKRSLRGTHLKAKYGMTLGDYERRLEQQGGGCAICGHPPGETALHVDHCHETGRIRGLLCFSCNAAIGHLQHDVGVIESALAYVAVHWRLQGLLGRDDDGSSGREG